MKKIMKRVIAVAACAVLTLSSSYALDYLNIENVKDINDTLIGSLMRSNSDVVIFMPQDILRLGKYSRINTPGVAVGNWQFRFRKYHNTNNHDSLW